MSGARPGLAAPESEDVSGLNCLEQENRGPSTADGVRMKIYLRGDDVEYLDWTSESGNKITRRQYYFHHRSLVAVVETIHTKGDRHTGELKHPRLVSLTKFDLEDPSCARRGEFLQRARELLGDFRTRRETFHPCAASHG